MVWKLLGHRRSLGLEGLAYLVDVYMWLGANSICVVNAGKLNGLASRQIDIPNILIARQLYDDYRKQLLYKGSDVQIKQQLFNTKACLGLCQKAEKQIDLWLIFPVVLDAGKKVQSRLVNFGFDFIILSN